MNALQSFLAYYMIAAAVLLIANAVWAYRDARQRGRSGILIALLVFWTFPLGVILWLYLRPELRSDRALEETAPESDADGEEGEDADADIKRRANAGLL